MSLNKIHFTDRFAEDAIEHLNYGVNKTTNEPEVCGRINCDNCKLNPADGSRIKCTQNFHKWLGEEYEKPQPFLTYREYCFLDTLRPVYKYMGRDRIDGLFISVSAPIKIEDGNRQEWGYSGTTLHSFNVKFDFIGTDKYWFIEDIKNLPIREEPKGK